MTTVSKKTRFRIPLRFRIKRWIMRLPPLIVWGAALLGAMHLYMRQEKALVITGFAQEIRFNVSSEVPGRIKRLDVAMHQPVRAGQIVAALDDSALLLRLQETRLELDRLEQELFREDALWDQRILEAETEQQTDLRRFARDIESAHIDYLRRLAQLAEDRVKIQGLELTLNRSLELQKTEITSLDRVDDDRVRYEALKESIAMQEPYVEELKKRYDESITRAAEYREQYVDTAEGRELLLKPFEYALKIQEVRIEQVNLDITRLVLRAPADGQVAQIFLRPGEVLGAGQPVVSMVEPVSTELVAYIPEERQLAVETGFKVDIRRKADPSVVLQSRISHVGSHVEPLPARLLPAPDVQAYGLAVYIPVPESMKIKPGEAFEVIPQYLVN